MYLASIVVKSAATVQFDANFWLQILQFVVALLSFFGFVLTSAVILILVERHE